MNDFKFNWGQSARNVVGGLLDLPLLPINKYRQYRTPRNTTEITKIPGGEMRTPVTPEYLSLTGRKPDKRIEINRTIDLTDPARTKAPVINTERWNRPFPVIDTERWNRPPAAPRKTVARAPSYEKNPKLGLSNFRRVDRPRSLDNL
tara:strand:+ start:1128 stop:1568 length:441 start_codon:yes stop_codon:yes gene_type:complete